MRLIASPFDSEHYGLAIGRLVRDDGDGPEELAAALAAARRERYAVVFVRLAADDSLRGTIEHAGHVPVDTLVTSTLSSWLEIVRSDDVDIEHHDRLNDP